MMLDNMSNTMSVERSKPLPVLFSRPLAHAPTLQTCHGVGGQDASNGAHDPLGFGCAISCAGVCAAACKPAMVDRLALVLL